MNRNLSRNKLCQHILDIVDGCQLSMDLCGNFALGIHFYFQDARGKLYSNNHERISDLSAQLVQPCQKNKIKKKLVSIASGFRETL